VQFQDDVVGGVTLVRPAIQSPNYATGTAGWTINADGTAEFSSVTLNFGDVSGSVTIADGRIQVFDNTDTLMAEITPRDGFENDGGVLVYETNPANKLYTVQMVDGLIRFYDGDDLPDLPGTIIYSVADAGTSVDPATLEISSGAQGTTVLEPATLALISATTARTARADLTLDGGVFAIDGVDQGRGLLDYQSTQANTGTVTTTETVAITTDSVTFRNGRAYEVVIHGLLQSSIAADVARVRARRTNTAGAILIDSMHAHYIPGANNNVLYDHAQKIINSSGSDITDVLVVTFVRTTGTGNVRIAADATNPAWIEIRDIGNATQYPSARAL
jgi:hypothetical protein